MGRVKVMLSLPEDAVRRLDELARRDGTTRSAVVRRLTEQAALRELRARRGEIERLYGRPRRRGGDALGAVKQARRAR
jgi:metal-responsive CopG/Arc/MetJ family transcriptional regulator